MNQANTHTTKPGEKNIWRHIFLIITSAEKTLLISSAACNTQDWFLESLTLSFTHRNECRLSEKNGEPETFPSLMTYSACQQDPHRRGDQLAIKRRRDSRKTSEAWRSLAGSSFFQLYKGSTPASSSFTSCCSSFTSDTWGKLCMSLNATPTWVFHRRAALYVQKEATRQFERKTNADHHEGQNTIGL